MLLGIDHVVIACEDPDVAAAALEEAVGLQAGGGGRHDDLGTWNRLVWLGDSYLELIGVFDRDLAQASWIGAPTLGALESGGGLVAFALATNAIDADVAALRARGSQLGDPVDGRRTRPDGEVVRWRLALPPALAPGAPPFLIEHELAGAEWGDDARRLRAEHAHPIGGTARLRRLEVAVRDVESVARRHATDVGLAFEPPGTSIREATVGTAPDRQAIRLLPAGHERPTAALVVAIASGRPRQADLLGCRFTVVLAEE